jgi:hypothetical protein
MTEIPLNDWHRRSAWPESLIDLTDWAPAPGTIEKIGSTRGRALDLESQ